MRIVIVGTSGSGKSTLAAALAEAQQVPLIELDALYWGPNWTPRPSDEFRLAIESATAAPSWVLDGNYTAHRPITWARATHVVWLNYSRARVCWQIINRTIKRVLRRKRLWAGNRETWRKAFLSRQSIIWWSLKTYGKNQRKYATLRADDHYSHLKWLEIAVPWQANEILRELARLTPNPPLEAMTTAATRPVRL